MHRTHAGRRSRCGSAWTPPLGPTRSRGVSPGACAALFARHQRFFLPVTDGSRSARCRPITLGVPVVAPPRAGAKTLQTGRSCSARAGCSCAESRAVARRCCTFLQRATTRSGENQNRAKIHASDLAKPALDRRGGHRPGLRQWRVARCARRRLAGAERWRCCGGPRRTPPCRHATPHAPWTDGISARRPRADGFSGQLHGPDAERRCHGARASRSQRVRT